MTSPGFTIGQTVRHCPELARDWHETRHADGMASRELGVGRVVARYDDSGFCGLCDYRSQDCPGPWYSVDFGGNGGGGVGLYGAHELVPA